MSETRCLHDMIINQCGLCTPRPRISVEIGLPTTDPFDTARIMPPWVSATFDSECSGCDGSIWAGEDIRADGSGGWEGRCCE